MGPIDRLLRQAARLPWLIASAGVLALAFNAAALRAAGLSNIGYLGLDAVLNRAPGALTLAPARAPEYWLGAAQPAAGDQRFEPAYGLGLADLAQGRYPQAIAAFQGAIIAYPGFDGTHALLGDAYWGAGNPSAAITEWQAGGGLGLLMARGDASGVAGDWPTAARWYLLASEVDPGSAAALWQLGLAYGSAGQSQAELDALARAVNLAPDNVQIRHALGLAYMRQGALDAAATQFERVLATDPNDFYTNLYLASIELQLGRLDAAEGHARQTTALAPGNPRAHAALGSVYYRRGQWALAIGELSRAVALIGPYNRQSSPVISLAEQINDNLLLAQSYQAAGQAPPAIAAYQAVLGLDPHNDAARAALQLLQPNGPP